MRQRHARRISPDIRVWDVFDGHRSRAPDGRRSAKHLDLWIIWIQLWLFLDLLRFGVRLVGIFALLQRLGYPGGVPFRVLDLLLCLVVGGAPDVDQVEKGRRRVKGCRRLSFVMLGQPTTIREEDLLGDLVGLDDTFRPIQCFLRELLDICLSCDVVCYSVLGCVLIFCLWTVSSAGMTSPPDGKPTCSSLSIRLVVYRRTSSSVVWSCFARIWLTTQYSPAGSQYRWMQREGEATTYTNRL